MTVVNRLWRMWWLMILLPQTATANQTLMVAVANNFYRPMQDLAQQYQQKTGVKIHLATGSSGQLAAQIEHGAPFDLFFSADQRRPERLEQLGLVESRVVYAQGRLVLWTKDRTWQPTEEQVWKTLVGSRLAIAEPSVAPYGKAAIDSLANQDLLALVKNQIVYGKGLNATYQFAATGNAHFAFLALSQVKNGQQGRYWEVPESLYAPILQQAVVVSYRSQRAAAEAFLSYVTSNEVQALLTHYGYGVSKS